MTRAVRGCRPMATQPMRRDEHHLSTDSRDRTGLALGLRAAGARRVALRPGHVDADGRRHRRLAGRRLAGAGLRHEPGVCLAGDRPAGDHRGLRRGGGSPEGTPGSTEKIDVAGAEAAEAASNNEAEASDFEEPSVEQTPAAMLDAVAEARASWPRWTWRPAMPRGGPVAGGRRASKLGTGGPGFGFGPGDGGVRREDRWSIVYNPGQTPDEYARQLDALGRRAGHRLRRPARLRLELLQPRRRRAGPARARGTTGSTSSGRAGAGRPPTSPCCRRPASTSARGSSSSSIPRGSRTTLAQLEVRYRGRQPAEIRVTRFSVVPQGDGYGFEVLDQQTLH